MKKIFLKSTYIVLMALMIISCDDKLNITDPTALGVDEFITDYASAKTALAQCYNEIQTNTAGTNEPVIVEYRMLTGLYSGELRHVGSFPSYKEAEINNYLVNNVNVSRIFAQHYRFINRATVIIRVIESISNISNSEKEEILAEAHAIRAFGYSRLVRLFGGLPLVEKVFALDGPDAKNTPKSSEAEVYQYILNEISLAKGKISTTNPNTFFTNDALDVLEAETHMYMEKYDLAENVLQGLIGKYTLDPSYANLFVLGNSSSSTIFRINYNAADNNNLAFYFTPTGRLEVGPSQLLLDTFEAGDTRISFIENSNSVNDSFITKYVDNAEGTDLPYIYRYADVLLMYAEVLARKNDPNAATYLNMIRNRAGLPDIGTFDSSNVVDVIARERSSEFFGEGKSWGDIKRLGLAPSVINSKTGVTFTEKQLLWPIPQNELDSNGSISQTDQNPGY
ncbi:RagB/SusD family nutrient uptake outer membrane protein [Tenacibaculum sp. 1_MG-2023]|uniref:RagB/SusD family nutrient uptake outer membrane protein n=1 Tax=Tenacibaculum sp. 1_MG-2023 TaxID=3062653 RepID=UPI0026E13D5C|nr:RagB/SusD family nutrient uptake outer membrane protein [Tenacibaculum sp. 1_MG-2023]MDO6674857.1 RagB/SusD family nutrient uptake outer membrane protein [Tenacibaculum sp. 1_MG-2023]